MLNSEIKNNLKKIEKLESDCLSYLNERVKELCEKYKLDFYSGNGGWACSIDVVCVNENNEIYSDIVDMNDIIDIPITELEMRHIVFEDIEKQSKKNLMSIKKAFDILWNDVNEIEKTIHYYNYSLLSYLDNHLYSNKSKNKI